MKATEKEKTDFCAAMRELAEIWNDTMAKVRDANPHITERDAAEVTGMLIRGSLKI